jgi:hypothetical protein
MTQERNVELNAYDVSDQKRKTHDQTPATMTSVTKGGNQAQSHDPGIT